MKKNVGLTYVEDFSFPAEQGFTGSTGKAKGYKRGGAVKKAKGGPVKKNMGGSVGLGQMGGMGQEREIQVDDVTITTPRARGGSVHDKLVRHGGKMGFMHGGQVKASPQFKTKRGKQKTMDTGTQPARRGRNQAEIEAGGTKRMLPGLKKGGCIKKARGGSVKKYRVGKLRREGINTSKLLAHADISNVQVVDEEVVHAERDRCQHQEQ